MKIAIASGKGGTGKTTIATNLAYTLGQMARQVQYIDCDVEEPNGHIFLKPVIENTEPVTVPVPQVDSEKCVNCGKCGELCQYSAIVCLRDSVLTFEQLCHSCGGCKMVCPTGAISEKPKIIGSLEIGRSGKIDFAQGRLEIGDVRTPALIKKLKQKIIGRAVSIIDAPPGTSCPVIEAVRDADFALLVTEPTPFGLNDLKLAVEMLRQLKLPFAVMINRSRPDEKMTNRYCEMENIEVIFELPDDRRIAEEYSVGQMIIQTLGEYKKPFEKLAKTIEGRSN